MDETDRTDGPDGWDGLDRLTERMDGTGGRDGMGNVGRKLISNRCTIDRRDERTGGDGRAWMALAMFIVVSGSHVFKLEESFKVRFGVKLAYVCYCL